MLILIDILLFDVTRITEHIERRFGSSESRCVVTSPRVFFEDFLPDTVGGLCMSLPIGTVVAFHVEGSDGGDWQIARTERGARVSEVDQTPKDCEMWCSEGIFMQIVSGALRSSRAFLNGDLRISGDVGLAMKCEILLREAA